jgi:hypothetical protein
MFKLFAYQPSGHLSTVLKYSIYIYPVDWKPIEKHEEKNCGLWKNLQIYMQKWYGKIKE